MGAFSDPKDGILTLLEQLETRELLTKDQRGCNLIFLVQFSRSFRLPRLSWSGPRVIVVLKVPKQFT